MREILNHLAYKRIRRVNCRGKVIEPTPGWRVAIHVPLGASVIRRVKKQVACSKMQSLLLDQILATAYMGLRFLVAVQAKYINVEADGWMIFERC